LADERRRIAALAGSIAETEDRISTVHEDIAQGTSLIADQAAGAAKAARAQAEHERGEQRRYSEPPPEE